ncbi:MAG: hypothetical protein KAS86_03090, partial [Candidatus Omnitrophica bacterium]|nr:hypothetical protein [Candidatus Omnitrophota bacterium]
MDKIRKGHSLFIKIIATGVLCVFSINTMAWAYSGGANLAVQSMFNPLSNRQIKDAGILKYYLHCLARTFDDLSAIPGDVNTRIEEGNIDVHLGFSSMDEPAFRTLLKGARRELIVPCRIAGIEYYAYMTFPEGADLPHITIFTKKDFEDIKEKGHIAHGPETKNAGGLKQNPQGLPAALTGKYRPLEAISVLDLVRSEMDEKKRSYILAEEYVQERSGLFVEAFTELGKELHIDISDRKQRKRLLNVCYQIVEKGREAWHTARKTAEFLRERTGFDYKTIKWGTKSKLMTVIYGVGCGKQEKFDYWIGLLKRLRVRFGIDSLVTLDHEERQRIVTAAFYIARGGRDKKEDLTKNEITFNMTMEFIKERFGLIEGDLLRDSSKGGMALSAKIRLITAAYNIALGKEARLKTFKDTIAAI